MLDLEVIPERSLGCEHWEFILGRFSFSISEFFKQNVFQFLLTHH